MTKSYQSASFERDLAISASGPRESVLRRADSCRTRARPSLEFTTFHRLGLAGAALARDLARDPLIYVDLHVARYTK